MAHDVQGGALLVDALQLELQAMGQVLRPHPGGLQGAQQGGPPLQQGQGDAAVRRQLVQGRAEVAVPVQAGGQEGHRPGGVPVQPHPVHLPGEELGESLLQPAPHADPGDGVVLILPQALVIAVLAVVVRQPAQVLELEVLPPGVRRGSRIGQIHHRVFLGQFLQILPQLQRAHL